MSNVFGWIKDSPPYSWTYPEKPNKPINLTREHIFLLYTLDAGRTPSYWSDYNNYELYKQLLLNGYIDAKKDKPSFKGLWAMWVYQNGRMCK